MELLWWCKNAESAFLLQVSVHAGQTKPVWKEQLAWKEQLPFHGADHEQKAFTRSIEFIKAD